MRTAAKPDQHVGVGFRASLSTQQRLSEQHWYQIVEEQEQLDSGANTTAGFAVHRQDSLGGQLPGLRHVRQSGISRAGGRLMTASAPPVTP
jgi:hypothetical protein